MTPKLWLKYIHARVKNVFVRTWCVVPLSHLAVARKMLGIDDLPVDEEAIRETAKNRDPFPCASCGTQVVTSSVEVADISTHVIQSIRRGRCQGCGSEAEVENRFYEGQMAAKVDGEWKVALVVPSLIDRVRWFFFREK